MIVEGLCKKLCSQLTIQLIRGFAADHESVTLQVSIAILPG
jgi:hypothetical protein